MKQSDIEADSFEILPDNWPTFCVFEAMSTQWRSGACGATGLDYETLPTVMRFIGIPKKDRSSVFRDIRSMEGEALSAMTEARDNSP